VVTLVAVKLTEAELDALDWLAAIEQAPSRSELIRLLLVYRARFRGISPARLHQLREEREHHPPRRSPGKPRSPGKESDS
jgi:hypothetical protein